MTKLLLSWYEILIQIINSSASLDICIAHTDEAKRKSKTKSLSDTVSIELFVGTLKPSFLVVKFLSILNDVPDNAPEPKGFSLRLLKFYYCNRGSFYNPGKFSTFSVKLSLSNLSENIIHKDYARKNDMAFKCTIEIFAPNSFIY